MPNIDRFYGNLFRIISYCGPNEIHLLSSAAGQNSRKFKGRTEVISNFMSAA